MITIAIVIIVILIIVIVVVVITTIEIIMTTIMAITMIAMFCRFSDRLSCRQAELESHAALVQRLLCSRRGGVGVCCQKLCRACLLSG